MGFEGGDCATTDRKLLPIPKEARAYQGHRAGILTRMIASVLDAAVVAIMMCGIYLGWAGCKFLLDPRTFTWPQAHSVLVGLSTALCVTTLYLAAMWALTGRSYRGHVMGLRVVNFRGQRMRPIGALVRATFCVFFPIGLLWCAVNHENRSIQDIALRTLVIYDWETHPS